MDEQNQSLSLQDRIGNWLKSTYETNKLLFFTVGILAGVAFLTLKYHNLLINILLGSSKDLTQEAMKKDTALSDQANKTKAEGNALVEKSKHEGDSAPTDENWNKK